MQEKENKQNYCRFGLSATDKKIELVFCENKSNRALNVFNNFDWLTFLCTNRKRYCFFESSNLDFIPRKGSTSICVTGRTQTKPTILKLNTKNETQNK